MEVLALKMKNNIKERRKAYDPTLELAIKTARLLERPVESIFFLDEES